MAATGAYLGARLPSTDQSSVQDRASSVISGSRPDCRAATQGRRGPGSRTSVPRRRMAEKPTGTVLHVFAPPTGLLIEDHFPQSTGVLTQPGKEKTTLANIHRRTYRSEHSTRGWVAGSVSKHDHRESAELLSRRGSRRILLLHVLREGSILRATQ